MSKIGKKNIVVPKDSSIKIEGSNLTVSGPKGTKTQVYRDYVSYVQKGQVKVPNFEKLPWWENIT